MFAAGQQVTVKRTSGELESDWYCWTDFNRQDGSANAYTAPECVRVMVIKPVEGHTIDEVRAGTALYHYKHVKLTDLMDWQPEPQLV